MNQHMEKVKVFQTVVASDKWKNEQEPDQRKAFFASFNKLFGKLGKNERSIRLNLLSALFGCPIGTLNQLSKFEIGALNELINNDGVWVESFSRYIENEFSGKPQDFCPRRIIVELVAQPEKTGLPDVQLGDTQPSKQHGDARTNIDEGNGFPFGNTDGGSIPSL